MAGKKAGGENSRKAAGNARKAEAEAQKAAAENARSEAAEAEEWSKGAKSNAKKYVRMRSRHLLFFVHPVLAPRPLVASPGEAGIAAIPGSKHRQLAPPPPK